MLPVSFTFACVSLAVMAAAQVPATQQKPISLDQVLGGGGGLDFRGRAPSVRWAPDGKHLIVGDDKQWYDPRAGVKRQPEAAPAENRPDPSAARAALVAAGLSEADARRLTERARKLSGDASYGVHDRDLWFFSFAGQAKRLTKDGAEKRIVQASPEGAHLSFVRGNNLVVVGTDGQEWAVTTDGSDDRLYGVLDWVYQEEVYGRGNFQGHWWSGNGKSLAFLSLDQSKVKTFVVIDHIVRGKSLDEERHVRPVPNKYPKAGDDNPGAALGVAHPSERKVVWVDLSRFPADRLIVHVGYTPDGSRVLFQVQDRIQTWLELCYADPSSGQVTTILREESKTGWVNRLEQPHWLADGSFLWQSERSGSKQIYHHEADGKLRRALTKEPLVVGDVVRVDEATKTLWCTGHDGRAIDRHLFRVSLDGVGAAVRVTKRDGTHQTSLSGDGGLFLDTFTSVESPAHVVLCDRDGKVLEDFGMATPKDLQAYGYVAPELFTVKCRDGFEIDASLVKPKLLDPTKKHPIWIETYSGPDAPSVRNVWSASAWTQFLQQQGYLVLQVNVRSASGKSQRATEACYKQLGVQELRDLEDAVAQVCKEPWADAARVGITGWSYGGTMTAFALTHSKAFKLGIAGAGVYDWRLYDSIYTERYMDTPQGNPQGYQASSVLAAAKNLHGHLLLIHGTDDDNVHLQNCMQLVYALQRAQKQFELMLYPTAMHGVSDPLQNRHMRTLMWNTMQAQLGGGGGQ